MSELRNMKKSLSDVGYREFRKVRKTYKNGFIYHYYTAKRNKILFDITIVMTDLNEYYDCIVDKKEF